MVKAGRELLKSGLIARTWGNISARISDTQFVITPSGRAYDDLTPDDIVVVNIEDCSYDGDIKPSSEKGVHAKGYQLRPECDFIIHTHQSNASALSILGKPIDDVASYSKKGADIIGDTVPCAEYGLSSTKKLMNNVAKAIEDNPDSHAVLMRYHGAVVFGETYDNAFKIAKALEDVSGKRYEELTGEKVRTITNPADEYCFVRDENLGDYRKSFKDDTIGAVIRVQTPYIRLMSAYGKTMLPYIDDLAQIAGTSVRCVKSDAGKNAIAKGIKNRACVFVQGKGAICVGKDASEAEAVCMVLEKGCQAAYLARIVGNIPPVGAASAAIERTVYVAKYSKLK